MLDCCVTNLTRDENTLSRDEVAELVDVPFNTLAVWRHNDLIPQPSIQGGTAKQARYTAEDTFIIYCFTLGSQVQKLKQKEASVLTRYLKHRPGFLDSLYHYWKHPQVTIYPTHDLAAFNSPPLLTYNISTEASNIVSALYDELGKPDEKGNYLPVSQQNYEVWGKYPIETLLGQIWDHTWGDRTPSEVIEMEARSDPEMGEGNARGSLAARIFRNAKHVQYGNSPKRRIHTGYLDYLDLSGMTIEQLLVAEAWALQWIDDALLQFGLGGPPGGGGSPNYTIDVSEALERVIGTFGKPETEARQLLPIPKSYI